MKHAHSHTKSFPDAFSANRAGSLLCGCGSFMSSHTLTNTLMSEMPRLFISWSEYLSISKKYILEDNELLYLDSQMAPKNIFTMTDKLKLSISTILYSVPMDVNPNYFNFKYVAFKVQNRIEGQVHHKCMFFTETLSTL